MLNRQGRGARLLLLLAFALTLAADAHAQDADAPRQGPPPRAEVNHEFQIHLLAAAEAAEGGARVPQSLEGVVRQLRSALPSSEYRLAATFIYRVRDGAGFDVKTAGGGSAFNQSPTPNQFQPTIFQMAVAGVKLIDPASAQSSINVQQFRLNMRVPIQTAAVKSEKGEATYPVIQYEDMGVSTQLSVREGEPTLVGTLNTSRPGQLFVIVVTVRRTGRQ